MSFFSYYPKGNYYNNTVTDILTRVAVLSGLKDKDNLYYLYNLKDGDTPENIAAKLYGDPGKHWVIMIINDIMDNIFDMPLDYFQFIKFLDKKYESSGGADYTKVTRNPEPFSNKLSIQTYETFTNNDSDGTFYSESSQPSTEVYYVDDTTANTFVEGTTNMDFITKVISKEPLYIYDWEELLNENKRKIKVLKPDYINLVEQEIKTIFK